MMPHRVSPPALISIHLLSLHFLDSSSSWFFGFSHTTPLSLLCCLVVATGRIYVGTVVRPSPQHDQSIWIGSFQQILVCFLLPILFLFLHFFILSHFVTPFIMHNTLTSASCILLFNVSVSIQASAPRVMTGLESFRMVWFSFGLV